MRKLNSSNKINELLIQKTCPLATALGLISGRWKPVILYRLLEKKRSFSELGKSIPEASERVLVRQINGLIRDNLVLKLQNAEQKKVYYQLSDKGESLRELLLGLSKWGRDFINSKI
jgi:DNA-binding HxlR family transcriptional regulator